MTTNTVPCQTADRQARRVRAVVAANARRKAEGLSDLDALFIAYDAGMAHAAEEVIPDAARRAVRDAGERGE